MVLLMVLLHSMPYFFFLYRSPSSSLSTVFEAISSNKHDVLSINTFANVFDFEDFIIYHNNWLAVSGELIDLVNSVIIFLIQMTLLR